MKKFTIHTLIAVICSCISVQVAYCQDLTKVHQFGFGYQNYRLIDQNYSPLIYHAHNLSLDYQFQKTKQKSIFETSANLAIGNNQPKGIGQRTFILEDSYYDINGNKERDEITFNPFISFGQIHANVAYYKPIKQNSNNSLWLGGSADEVFTYSGVGADTWFFNELSVSPTLKWKHQFQQNAQLETNLSFPIAAYLVHAPYSVDPSLAKPVSYVQMFLETGSNIATINDFQKVNFNTTYQFEWQNRTIGLRYSFMYFNYNLYENRDFSAYTNEFGVVMNF